MDKNEKILVILAGGRSLRMGQDKAQLKLGGTRLIDRLIERFQLSADKIMISASENFGTGLDHIPDNPAAPDGPAGAIFSIAAGLGERSDAAAGFVTVPVDAPFAPIDLVPRLTETGTCSVAQAADRLQPTFAYWKLETIEAVRGKHRFDGRSPSLHWLVRQCQARPVSWPDEHCFLNVNTPDDLTEAEKRLIE